MNPTRSHVAKISPISIGQALRRERLLALLEPDSPTRAFWISGPGGAGKTTLIADFLDSKKLPSLWYQVDSLDGDPATFFYYFGRATEPLLVEEHSPPLLTREYLPEIDIFILHYFEALFQRLRPGSWLVFDNFQDAPEGSPLPRILHAAIKQLPPHITVAVLSRSDPPPNMARFIANRTLKHIGWNQLAFTADEFTSFLDFSGSTVAAPDAARLHFLTKGWIAGVVLWLLHYSGEEIPDTVPAQWTPENIFDYFASEILEKTSAEIRTFLLQTAFLPNMTVEMAEELTGMPAAEILESLYRKNFFVEKHRLRLVSYQYHPLFRRFLSLQAVRFYDAGALQSLRCRAAKILELHDLAEEAFRLYSQVDAFGPMQTLILSRAQVLIDQGRYTVLSAWIDTLPEEQTRDHPWLLVWKSVAMVPYDPKESVRLATEAYRIFAKNNDIAGQVLSWSTVVDILTMMRSGFAQLDGWIEEGGRLGDLLSDDDESIGLSSRFAAAMLMALLLRNQGHPEMEKWQTRCEKLFFRCRDQQIAVALIKNLFWSYYWLGQLHKALNMESGLRNLRDSGTLPPFGQIIMGALLALAGVMRGDHPECHRLVRESLDLAEKTGIHVFDFLIVSFSVYSALGQGELQTVQPLLTKLEGALSNYAIWDKGQYHYLLAWYAMQDGDLQNAEEHLKIALSLEKACGNPLTIALCKILRSQLLLELGRPAKAEAVLGSMLSEPRLGHNRILPFLVALAQADCAYSQQREEEARDLCARAFAAARKEGLWIPFGLSNKRLSVVCSRALQAEIEKEMVLEMIKRWNLKPSTIDSASEPQPWPIRIVVLGRFSIHCHEEPLTLSAKAPKKPLELLSLLICAGQNGILRETAADKLWPDSDGDRAIRALNTTVHRLRRLLGDDEVVAQQGGHLMLNKERCWVDCWRFQSLAHRSKGPVQPETAEKICAEALSLYQGEYSIGYGLSAAVRYANQLHNYWLDVVAATLPASAARGFSEDAGRAIRQALTADDSAVAIFQKMIGSYRKSGATAEAVDLLQHCRNLLMEQGLALGQKAEDFLKDLRKP